MPGGCQAMPRDNKRQLPFGFGSSSEIVEIVDINMRPKSAVSGVGVIDIVNPHASAQPIGRQLPGYRSGGWADCSVSDSSSGGIGLSDAAAGPSCVEQELAVQAVVDTVLAKTKTSPADQETLRLTVQTVGAHASIREARARPVSSQVDTRAMRGTQAVNQQLSLAARKRIFGY